MDWLKGAKLVNYKQSASNGRLVGTQVSKLLQLISQNTDAVANSFHVIGFSLGAHIAGYAGRLMRISRTPIGRISGRAPELRHQE